MSELAQINDGYTTRLPREKGFWSIKCNETDYAPHVVQVFKKRKVFWVHCPDAGTYPLETYHYNLTTPSWKKVT